MRGDSFDMVETLGGLSAHCRNRMPTRQGTRRTMGDMSKRGKGSPEGLGAGGPG